jgi:xanthine dehydrogenase accessory factor
MRSVVPDIERWLAGGEQVGLATVIETWGSAPRQAGARLALTSGGQISGSVSGGCVEGAVIETGGQVLKTGQAQLLHFGVADETAWEVGLACGGTLEVFVQPLDLEVHRRVHEALAADQPLAIVTVVRGPAQMCGREMLVYQDGEAYGTLGQGLDDAARAAARAALEGGQPRRHVLAPSGDLEVFIDVQLPAPTLIVVGGAHITVTLAKLAKVLGYRTIVIDPRKVFGSQERFPQVDQLIQAWPDEALAEVELTRSTAIAMLTHDPKIDDPAIRMALNSPAFYVGALGSQRTQARRRQRLLKGGVSEAQLERLHGPIGLAIGAQTPDEIALAIMGEIVAERRRQTHSAVVAAASSP